MHIKHYMAVSARQRACLLHEERKVGTEKVLFVSWVFLRDRPCVFLCKCVDVVCVEVNEISLLWVSHLDDGVENDFLFWNWGHVYVFKKSCFNLSAAVRITSIWDEEYESVQRKNIHGYEMDSSSVPRQKLNFIVMWSGWYLRNCIVLELIVFSYNDPHMTVEPILFWNTLIIKSSQL